MRIIVTGSSGLLGRAVIDAVLGAGHSVLGIDPAPAPAGAGWDHVTADLTDIGIAYELINGADAVFHLAAIPRPTGRAASEVFSVNMALAYNVVEAGVRSGIFDFVYASSFSVFGFPFFSERPRLNYLPIDDRHPTGPQDSYAMSKWLGEEVVEAFARRTRLRATGLRLPWVQTPESFERDIGPRFASGEGWRDLYCYIDARDAGQAFLKALETGQPGHRRISVAAADAYADLDLRAEMALRFPEAKLPESLDRCMDIEHARNALGFTPKWSWRDYPRNRE